MKVLFALFTASLLSIPSLSALAATSHDSAFAAQAEDEVTAEAPESDALVAGLGLSSDSSDDDYGSIEGIEVPKACQDIKLTDAQKKQIVDLYFTYRKQQIEGRAAVRLARLHYLSSLINNDGNSVDKDSLDIASRISALVTARIQTNNQLIFKILNDDQRKEGIRCEVLMRRALVKRRLSRLCNGVNAK